MPNQVVARIGNEFEYDLQEQERKKDGRGRGKYRKDEKEPRTFGVADKHEQQYGDSTNPDPKILIVQTPPHSGPALVNQYSLDDDSESLRETE